MIFDSRNIRSRSKGKISVPLRIRMTTGKTFDFHRPDPIFVGRAFPIIGKPSTDYPTTFEDASIVVLARGVEVQNLPRPVQAASCAAQGSLSLRGMSEMIIFIWFVYKAKLTMSVDKRVMCESCKSGYIYSGICKSVGIGETLFNLNESGARMRAEADALRRLPNAVARFNLQIPCPMCGHYQKSMIRQFRRDRLEWMNLVGYGLVLPAIISAGLIWAIAVSPAPPKPIHSTIIASVCSSLILSCIGFPLWRFMANLRFDPNRTDLQERLALGRSAAVPAGDRDPMYREASPDT